MKLIPPILLTFIATATLAHSQAEPPAASAVASAASVTTARILGEIPDGTPPPPAPPKPEYHVATRDVLATATHEQGGRTITIREIKPIALPPLPLPSLAVDTELSAEFKQRLAEYRKTHPKTDLFILGATVFRSKDSPPRTLVRYWPDGKGGHITFWSSADFALIAGGINTFVDTAGDRYQMLLAWGNADIDRIVELRATKGLNYNVPVPPVFPEGKATFQIICEQPDAERLTAVQSLHDIYNSEFDRLKTAHEGRERARIEREEYLKANPPQPKDITLNYWRTEKPASNRKGESK
jgi:hypothetical protein